MKRSNRVRPERPAPVVLVALPILLGAGCLAEAPVPVERPADDGPRAPIEATRVLDAEAVRLALQHSPLPDPPPDPTNAFADRPDAARLGQALFFDTRLSASGEISCAVCHDPAHAFTDGLRLSVGMAPGRRHTPTVLNAAYQRWFFWDGRSDSLWAQALEPLEAPGEHGSDRLAVAHVIAGDPSLRRAFEDVFGPLPPLEDASRFPAHARPVPDDPSHPHDVAWRAMAEADRAAATRTFVYAGKAIAAYERRLLSRRSRFDRFAAALRAGDEEGVSVLAEAEQRGLATFVGKGGCRLCHAGPELTDREFHDTRVPTLHGGRAVDPGRYGGIAALAANPFNGAGPHSDAPGGPARDRVDRLVRNGASWGEFKTPSLRNVELTAPYMHQGQFETLEEVVRYYSTLEGARPAHDHGETTMVPLGLTDEEIDDLVAFLRTLTDDALDPALTRPPDLDADRR